MSKPMTRLNPALTPVRAIATTPPGGPGQDRVLAGEEFRRREAARRHHEHDPRARALDVEIARHLADIAGQDRRQIGVDHRRVAAPDELDQRRSDMAFRDLGKSELARDLADHALVRRIAIGVHEDDRDRVEALGLRSGERGAHASQDRARPRRFRPRARARRSRSRPNRAAPASECCGRRFSAAPGSRSRARRESRASSPAACARRAVRAARWSRPSFPS